MAFFATPIDRTPKEAWISSGIIFVSVIVAGVVTGLAGWDDNARTALVIFVLLAALAYRSPTGRGKKPRTAESQSISMLQLLTMTIVAIVLAHVIAVLFSLSWSGQLQSAVGEIAAACVFAAVNLYGKRSHA